MINGFIQTLYSCGFHIACIHEQQFTNKNIQIVPNNTKLYYSNYQKVPRADVKKILSDNNFSLRLHKQSTSHKNFLKIITAFYNFMPVSILNDEELKNINAFHEHLLGILQTNNFFISLLHWTEDKKLQPTVLFKLVLFRHISPSNNEQNTLFVHKAYIDILFNYIKDNHPWLQEKFIDFIVSEKMFSALFYQPEFKDVMTTIFKTSLNPTIKDFLKLAQKNNQEILPITEFDGKNIVIDNSYFEFSKNYQCFKHFFDILITFARERPEYKIKISLKNKQEIHSLFSFEEQDFYEHDDFSIQVITTLTAINIHKKVKEIEGNPLTNPDNKNSILIEISDISENFNIFQKFFDKMLHEALVLKKFKDGHNGQQTFNYLIIYLEEILMDKYNPLHQSSTFQITKF